MKFWKSLKRFTGKGWRKKRENLKISLAFASDRLSVERKFNEENSRKGNFKEINKNLGNTFLTGIDFGSKDFFNELSTDVADFGGDLKQAFKDGDGINYCFTYKYMGETVTVNVNSKTKRTKAEYSLGKRKRSRADIEISEVLKNNTLEAYLVLS